MTTDDDFVDIKIALWKVLSYLEDFPFKDWTMQKMPLNRGEIASMAIILQILHFWIFNLKIYTRKSWEKYTALLKIREILISKQRSNTL